MTRKALSIYALVALATPGLWWLWMPSYFLFLFPPLVSETTAWHFARAFAASAALAVAWALFVRRVARSRLDDSAGIAGVRAATAMAFALFLALAVAYLFRLYREAAG